MSACTPGRPQWRPRGGANKDVLTMATAYSERRATLATAQGGAKGVSHRRREPVAAHAAPAVRHPAAPAGVPGGRQEADLEGRVGVGGGDVLCFCAVGSPPLGAFGVLDAPRFALVSPWRGEGGGLRRERGVCVERERERERYFENAPAASFLFSPALQALTAACRLAAASAWRRRRSSGSTGGGP